MPAFLDTTHFEKASFFKRGGHSSEWSLISAACVPHHCNMLFSFFVNVCTVLARGPYSPSVGRWRSVRHWQPAYSVHSLPPVGHLKAGRQACSSPPTLQGSFCWGHYCVLQKSVMNSFLLLCPHQCSHPTMVQILRCLQHRPASFKKTWWTLSCFYAHTSVVALPWSKFYTTYNTGLPLQKNTCFYWLRLSSEQITTHDLFQQVPRNIHFQFFSAQQSLCIFSDYNLCQAHPVCTVCRPWPYFKVTGHQEMWSCTFLT